MKSFKYIAAVIAVFLLTNYLSYSREDKIKNVITKDSAISFKVYGTCEMCKHRIEEAAKGKGVSSVNWDVNTKMLSLVYTPAITTLEKIHKRISAVGHDTELEKANDPVYKDLPACCHYREMESMKQQENTANETTGELHFVNGVVLEDD